MECKKRIFETFDEATKALNTIKEYPDYNEKAKKEQRAYKCPLCNKYHLTSISQSEGGKFHSEMKKKQQKRIEKASTYWEQKLGIKKDL